MALVGLRSRNTAGTWQVEGSYPNFVLRGNARTQFSTMTPPKPGQPGGQPPPGANAASIIVSDNLFDEPYFGWNWGYCWLFQSPTDAGMVASTGVGLRVRNEITGQVMYDSGHKHLQVVDYVKSFGDFTYSYPAGRIYRVAPLHWAGIDRIRDQGDAGMGDGSRLYDQEWTYISYQISGNAITTRLARAVDQELWDGPPGMAGSVGDTPRLDFLVVDITGF